jgi:pimeloyl-ACP methyl ester carboxylesterase
MSSETKALPLAVERQGYFFVGGRYIDSAKGKVRTGQMYVEYQIPAHLKSDVPIVLFSGNGQSGLNYTGTPDGREGWAQFFLRAGYRVYILDQPSRARSAHLPETGDLQAIPARFVESRITATRLSALWPQAALHTQWPGSGLAGDAVFDQYMDQLYPSLTDIPLQQQLNLDAGIALLDRIGPAILMTHSQAGTYGWLIADARPELVKAIVAVEPSGPPVRELSLTKVRTIASEQGVAGEESDVLGALLWYEDGALSRPFGLTALPLTYDPPLEGGTLQFVRDELPAGAALVRGWKQAEPARALANLRHIPVLVLTGEASYHASYDHCTVEYLRQASVATAFIRLSERGIHGNGHMLMIELNNRESAAVVEQWLGETLGMGEI